MSNKTNHTVAPRNGGNQLSDTKANFQRKIEFLEQVYRCDQTDAAIDRMEEAMQYSGTPTPSGVCILGNSGEGKSTCIKAMKMNYPKKVMEEKTLFPVISIEVSSSISESALLSDILEQLEDKDSDLGTNQSKKMRVKRLIRECEVKLIMIDEFQDLLPKAKLDSRSRGVKFTKWLMNSTGVSVVALGLPELAELRLKEQQFKNRFMSDHHLSRFSIKTPTDYQNYVDYLHALRKNSPIDLSIIEEPRASHALLVASDGNFRNIVNIIRSAIRGAGDCDKITLKHLHDGWARHVKDGHSKRGNLQPFKTNLAKLKRLALEVS